MFVMKIFLIVASGRRTVPTTTELFLKMNVFPYGLTIRVETMQNVSLSAGCDMVVSGFAQIQGQLQYRASGCIGLPVAVGTSRGAW